MAFRARRCMAGRSRAAPCRGSSRGRAETCLPAGAVRGRAAGRRNVEGLNFDRELTGSGLGKGSIPDGMTIQDYPVKNGESIWDYFGEERRDMILEDAAANGGYAVSSPSTEHFGIAEDNRAWVQPKLTSHPARHAAPADPSSRHLRRTSHLRLRLGTIVDDRMVSAV